MDNLVVTNICRLCANVKDHVFQIFDEEGYKLALGIKINKYLQIQVSCFVKNYRIIFYSLIITSFYFAGRRERLITEKCVLGMLHKIGRMYEFCE